MILLIDNYDSFVHNLARYFERLGVATRVVRNDQIDSEEIANIAPQAIVLSPGPCTPNEAGASLEIVRRWKDELPILGVCLGHQTIAAALGAKIVRADEPRHGRASLIHHEGAGLFAGLPNPLRVGRYHSLVVEPSTLSAELVPTAWCSAGQIMAFAHRSRPVFGVQFHPESILTERGLDLLANYLRAAGITPPVALHSLAQEWVAAPRDLPYPSEPISF